MSKIQLETWVRTVCAELKIDPAEVDVQLLLDVARDAAHSVTRPAAPLTTFLVGYAAGKGLMTAAQAGATASALAEQWSEEESG